MVSIKRRLQQPKTLGGVCCFLLGVLGVALVFVGIGGGFLKPIGYSLNCNSTSAARLNCVGSWDKNAPNTRLYSNLCVCEREFVVVAGVPKDVSPSPQIEVGAHLAWTTRRIYNRTEECSKIFPSDEQNTPCWWYPTGDSIDNTTAYDYGDKTEFQSSNGVFAVGMLLCFVSIVVNLYIVLISFCPAIGCF